MYHSRPSITQKRLRELSPRAARAVERHKAHYGVAAAAVTLVPATEAYIKVYDEAAKYRSAHNAKLEQGRHRLSELHNHLRSTLAIVNNHVPSFDTRELQGTVDTPERLLSDASKVLEVLAGQPLPQAEPVVAVLKEAIEKAQAEWAEAQAARVALQQAHAVVREHAQSVNRELIALRRLLRVIVGTSHIDFQSLRTSRRQQDVDEDDAVVEDDSPEATAPSTGVSNNVVNDAANGVNGASPAVATTQGVSA